MDADVVPDLVVGNLTQGRELELDDIRAYFQPKPFYDSDTLIDLCISVLCVKKWRLQHSKRH